MKRLLNMAFALAAAAGALLGGPASAAPRLKGVNGDALSQFPGSDVGIAGVMQPDAASGYSFVQSAGTYTEITGGTSLATVCDDESFNANTIPFTFLYNNVPYTQFSVNCNGILAMGASVTLASPYTPIATAGGTNNVISALGRDLNTYATGSEVRYETLGASPNRVLVVQWKNMRAFSTSATGDSFNFQIRLYETSNVVEVGYGAFTKNATSRTVQVGLRGAANTDFNIRTGSNWAASTAGATNGATMTLSTTALPALGQTYAWTPPNFPPVVSYTTLGNTISTANRALSGVAINDADGVNGIAGTRPRVYYKRASDLNAWNDNTSGTAGWKYAEANGGASPFDFTIDYALLSGGAGVATGDVVQYFVVAQDLAGTPAVAINSGTFAATPSSVALTAAAFPIGGTINSYTIATPISGTITVPGSYPSLTNAGGAFEAINGNVLTGNVTIEIAGDLSGETGTVALNQWAEGGAGGYTLTIKPTGAARIITGTNASSLIKLNGADRVTIDGSLSGGTDQNLTIENTGAGTVIWIASVNAGNGATSDTIKNSFIKGNGASVGGILSSGSVLGGDAEAANSNNTISNNVITKVQNAAYLRGGAAPATFDQNWLVTGNTFGSTVAADKLSFRGMLIGNSQNFTISGNSIHGVVSSASSTSTMSGIQVALLISGGSITGNRISDIKQVNTTGYGCNGIYLGSSSAAANLTVANNFIYDVAAFGFADVTAADNGYGMFIAAGGGYVVAYNSVLMSTDQTAAGGIPAAINIGTGLAAGAVDLRDNIFANTQTIGTRYAIYSASANTAFATINYNDYVPGTGNVGFLGAAQATLSAWQTATGQDANSISADPLFVSATDLHIAAGSPVIAAGTPIAGISTDIDGETRNAATPAIGADEFVVYRTVTPSVGTPSGSISPSTPQNVADGSTVAFTLTADPGFHIDTVGGDCPTGALVGSSYTTGAIVADCSVVANFAADVVTHTVTAVVGTPSGTITPPSATVNNGDTTAFTVTADPGFHIDTVTGCGGTLAANTYTTGPITADCTVTANFAANGGGGPLLSVDLSVANQITITTTSGLSAATISGPTSTGFYFQNFFASAGTQTLGTTTIVGTATLTAASVTADGSPSLFRGASGADTGLNVWSYSATATTTFTAGLVAFSGTATWSVPAATYAAMLTAPASGNLYFPADDSTDVATLLGTYSVIHPGPVTHTVTAVVGTASGTITPPSAVVNDGATTAFTVTADAGFHIDTVTGCGGTLAANTYTTGPITADCTVTANFAADVVTHTVTAVVGTPAGTITPPSATVNDGATTAFTVTADAGFHIDTVTGCGGTLAANTYTTGPITSDCTVTANFAADGGVPLLTVDLSVANQITVSASSGLSAATVSGATTTGFYFQDFLASAGTVPLGTTTIVGAATLTAASVTSDGSPALFRGASGADAGLNIWSYSATTPTTFTTGQVAFTGTATWSLAPAVYTAMLTAPNSGNLYFPADDSTDIASATLLGTYSVIHPGAGNPPAATVTPTTLSFTVAANATATQTLNIANAAGSDALTYAITGQASRAARLIAHTSKSRKTGEVLLRSHGGRMLRAGAAVHAAPAPWSPVGPDGSFAFQADDGSYENGIAWTDAGGTTQNTSLWLNRYAATGPMTIDTVSIEWPGATAAAGDVTGKSVNLVAYFDADSDGDPSNATRLGSNTPITINGPDAFETYPTNFVVPAAGDVYLGFVDTFAAGGTTPVLYSASLDTEGDPNVGWVAAMSTGDADVDVIGNNDNIGTLDGLSGGSLAGVWMVRGTGTGTVSACAGAVVNWLSANPASGSVTGGANTNVTITANPSADSLAPGSYTGMLCIATNDPTQALIGVPVSLTVTEAPFVPCSAADEIFCDGFDPAAPATVITGTINQPAVANGDGSSFDFALEDFHGYDSGITTDDINLYTLGAPAISVYWYGDLTPPEVGGLTGGVVGTSGGTDFVVLHSGDVIGPASPVSAASQGADMSAFEAGVNGYIGVAFYNEVTSTVNYGYLHVQTSAGGFPIQVLDYGYDNSGAAITIP